VVRMVTFQDANRTDTDRPTTRTTFLLIAGLQAFLDITGLGRWTGLPTLRVNQRDLPAPKAAFEASAQKEGTYSYLSTAGGAAAPPPPGAWPHYFAFISAVGQNRTHWTCAFHSLTISNFSTDKETPTHAFAARHKAYMLRFKTHAFRASTRPCAGLGPNAFHVAPFLCPPHTGAAWRIAAGDRIAAMSSYLLYCLHVVTHHYLSGKRSPTRLLLWQQSRSLDGTAGTLHQTGQAFKHGPLWDWLFSSVRRERRLGLAGRRVPSGATFRHIPRTSGGQGVGPTAPLPRRTHTPRADSSRVSACRIWFMATRRAGWPLPLPAFAWCAST